LGFFVAQTVQKRGKREENFTLVFSSTN